MRFNLNVLHLKVKKSTLFLIISLVAVYGKAQQVQLGIPFNHSFNQKGQLVSNLVSLKAGYVMGSAGEQHSVGVERKTTGPCITCGRWYDYADSVLGTNPFVYGAGGMTYSSIFIWQDTTGLFGYYTGGYPDYESTKLTSVGLLFHPWASAWNSRTIFQPSEIAITDTDAYTIDSIMVGGAYYRNPAKPSVVDTLVVQFVYGNGDSISNLPFGIYYPPGSGDLLLGDYGLASTDSISFVSMLFDSLLNAAGAAIDPLMIPYPIAGQIPSPTIIKYPLTASDTNSTSLITVYPRPASLLRPADAPINIPIPRGNISGVSVSFKSGDPALTHIYPHDTIYNPMSFYYIWEYGVFVPLLVFAQDGSTSENPVFPPYLNIPPGTDWTSGYFKEEGASDTGGANAYKPNWGWTTPSNGATILQYPYIWFHVECPLCQTVGTISLAVNSETVQNQVNAYPNPTGDELNISYTLANTGEASVTLMNIVGQTVIFQKIENAKSGNTVLDIHAIPDGVYFYIFEANGTRATGRIIINH